MPAKKYQLAVYRSKALKPDFELVIDDKTSIIIPPPNVDEVLDLNEITNVRAQLQIIAKDKYEDLMKVVGGEQGGVLKPLMNDMLDHFGLGE